MTADVGGDLIFCVAVFVFYEVCAAMKFGLVVVAAGQGRRLKLQQRKALVPVGGVPLLARALENFSALPGLMDCVLVAHRDDIDDLEQGELSIIIQGFGVRKIVAGGEERQDSVLNGLLALAEDIEVAVVHDAARPFVDHRVVSKLLKALEQADGAVPVIRATSTVKRVDSEGRVLMTVPREELCLAQTPQVAYRHKLIEALQQARRAGQRVTDDVQALELSGGKVVVVEDSRWNFKVTTPEDLLLAEFVAENELWKRSGDS